MIGYLNIYIFFYIINLLSLQFLLKQMFGSKLYTLSLTHMTYHIFRYSRLKFLYFGLVVSLAGLPPFFLFFVKFNFLIESYFHFGFFFFYIVFLTICVHMFFYIQPIILNNTSFDAIPNKFSDTSIKYNELCLIVFFFFFSIVSIFFFPDFYLSTTISF